MRYLFEGHALDTDRRELCRGPDVLAVAPQVFDLLAYLIRHRERVVSKDELISAIWNGRAVSDAALTTRLNVVRCAIGDNGEQQRLIKTLPRKGFRFVGAVQGVGNAMAEPAGSAMHDGNSTPVPSPPHLSILVLPLASLGGEPDQDYFAAGITESLTADLSRIDGTFVIACNTALTFRGKAIDVRQLGRELNVKYVLQGSVQRGADRLRVNVQLIDAETRAHLWTDRFDKPMTDLLEMQDEIVTRLANALDAQLIEAEARRAERAPHPDAIDLCFQGRHLWNTGLTPERLAQARGFFERALVLDPENVEALVGIAHVDLSTATTFMVNDRDAYFNAADVNLTKVLSMNPRHARARLAFGVLHLFTGRGSQAIVEFEQALALDRNMATAHALIGFAKVFVGQGAESEAHIQQALRISPRDSFTYRWMHWLGVAKLILGAYEEAIDWLRRSLEANRNNTIVHLQLAAALALVGLIDDAKAAAREGLALDPAFTTRRTRGLILSTDPTFRAGSRRIRDGMLLAGIPEG
ncbi:winged helix-turn-helix domain-containing protein [Bradyrhizobium sp. B117]|uniref:winged helix-turn-helix domain-containing tetratricopeptide repeat protein n=1 Tax=Bradyrhizobium sp. B117 TaxID=3140246 RepID=UPI003182E3FA